MAGFLEDGFLTARLAVRRWTEEPGEDWLDQLAAILIPPVLASLPPSWNFDAGDDRIGDWVRARDAEALNFTIRANDGGGDLCGLLILGPPDPREAPPTLRLGYLIAQSHWRRGLAGELVGGLVRCCRQDGGIGLVIGGVGRDNPASAAVLRKNGFVEDPGESTLDTVMYRLDLGLG